MLRIRSLGGAGEDSRNCFLISSGSINILLDCGVRREIAETARVYPALTEEIARSLDAVIISHAHEDHTAALPYLYELGYRGNIYASQETISLIPDYLRKWADYVEANGGQLPFDRKNIDHLSYLPVTELELPVTWGRSSHMAGALWYLLELEGHRILYTGDITMDSLLLERDQLPQADTLIIDCAYAGKVINQESQYQTLLELSRNTKGLLLLPVPANGRAIDMFEYLKPHDLDLFVEPNILKNDAQLFTKTQWIKCPAPVEGRFETVTADIRNSCRRGTYLFSDGMMTTAVSREYFETVRNDPDSHIVISGHSALGTLARSLQDEQYRKDNDILCQISRLTIKVHLDEKDVLKAVRSVKPQRILLFHAQRTSCDSLIEKLEKKGLEVLCDLNGELILS